ncbi:MAG: acetolactate synthase large subunit [Luteolibacter sp.]
MTASDHLVKCLEAEGVEYIFGIPGEENLDFLDSLSRSHIKLILTRHEQGAGFMAATYGRLTGKTGVCLSTLGPGATNLVTAAAYAQLGGMPMMMITGQKPVKRSKQGRFQILDVVEMMKPITKFTHQIVSVDNIACRVREAIRLAEEERPGAVHLELPEDIAGEPAHDLVPIPASAVRRPVAEGKSIANAVQLIAAAKHPLLLIAAGANRKLTSRMLSKFVKKTGIPFISTQLGKGVVDENSDLFLGNAALSDGDYLHRAIQHADLIINVGHDVIEKPPFFMRNGDTRKVIHINFFSAMVDPVYFPQVEVVGDIANSIWQIAELLDSQNHWDFSRFMDIKAAADAQRIEFFDDPGFPVKPQRLVSDVRKTLSNDGIIALDNGIYKIWFARHYNAAQPNTVLLDNALATMGAGLPSAMAAKIVHPKRDVIAICGDGGFMMNSQELETAVRLGLHLTVVIIRDDSYGMIRWKQTNMKFNDYGLTFGNPDFVLYARSYGAKGHRVTSTEQLLPLLEKCRDEPAVHVIDLAIDYSDNDRILNHEIKERAAAV